MLYPILGEFKPPHFDGLHLVAPGEAGSPGHRLRSQGRRSLPAVRGADRGRGSAGGGEEEPAEPGRGPRAEVWRYENL